MSRCVSLHTCTDVHTHAPAFTHTTTTTTTCKEKKEIDVKKRSLTQHFKVSCFIKVPFQFLGFPAPGYKKLSSPQTQARDSKARERCQSFLSLFFQTNTPDLLRETIISDVMNGVEAMNVTEMCWTEWRVAGDSKKDSQSIFMALWVRELVRRKAVQTKRKARLRGISRVNRKVQDSECLV